MREPFKAPEYMPGEFNHHWLERVVQAFEQWANQPAHLTATPQVEQRGPDCTCADGNGLPVDCEVHNPEQPAAGDEVREIAKAIVQDVCELPDYNSPDDQPDLLQCTVDELANIALHHVRTGLSDHIAKQVVPDGEVANDPDELGLQLSKQEVRRLKERGFLIIRAPQL